MPKVSIILPVYNCADYLPKCIQSVLNQTHKDIELVIVVDGATDNSGEISESFAGEDRRVKVIHQKNAGVSAARNTGLDAATGEYIGFVDADDYITEETYEMALTTIEDCDIAMWDVVTVWDNGSTEEDTIPLLGNSCKISRGDWSPDLLAQMAGSVCRCLYRRELLDGMRFPVGIKLSEDRLFNIHAMGKARKLSYFKRGMYMRYVRKGSAVNRYHGDIFEKNILAMKRATQIIEACWTPEYLKVYTEMLMYQGALAAIYEICTRNFPGRGRVRAIGKITASQELKQSFRAYPPKGLRERLLSHEANVALCAVGYLFQWKRSLTEMKRNKK